MQILDTFHLDPLSLHEGRESLRQSQESPRSSDTTSHYTIPPDGEREAVTSLNSLDFELPPELEAGEPPEARGLARDEVRLMVSYRENNRVVHTQFRQIGDFLDAGDAVFTRGDHSLAVWTEGCMSHPGGMYKRVSYLVAVLRVPDYGGAILTCRNNPFSIWAEAQ